MEILLGKVPGFNKNCTIDRQSTKRIQRLLFRLKQTKNQEQDTKERSPKKLKKKKIHKKPKKRWFFQKHTGLMSRLYESLTKTIKYKYFQNQKQNKYAYKNQQK